MEHLEKKFIPLFIVIPERLVYTNNNTSTSTRTSTSTNINSNTNTNTKLRAASAEACLMPLVLHATPRDFLAKTRKKINKGKRKMKKVLLTDSSHEV